MKSYDYLRLHTSSSGVFIRCTNRKTVEWIANEVRKLAPSCQMEQSKSGTYKLSHLQSRDLEIGDWITQQLCIQGWEPFAVTSIYRSDTDPVAARVWGSEDVLHFKFEMS